MDDTGRERQRMAKVRPAGDTLIVAWGTRSLPGTHGAKDTVKCRQPAINDVNIEQPVPSLLVACPLYAGRSLASADELASGLPSGVRCDSGSVGAGENGVAAVVEGDVGGAVRPRWGIRLDADPAFGPNQSTNDRSFLTQSLCSWRSGPACGRWFGQ